MGMELSVAIIRENMPEYLPHNQTGLCVAGGLVAPLSGDTPGLVRAQVSHGVRQVVL